jgi:TATA-box binding protein (TBP) (component of TFIID and TFIIIB)
MLVHGNSGNNIQTKHVEKIKDKVANLALTPGELSQMKRKTRIASLQTATSKFVVEKPKPGKQWKSNVRARRCCKAKTARYVGRMLVQNMVYSVEVGVRVSLAHLARCYSDFVEYNPKRFAAAIIRFKKPIVTLLLFSSGKGVCTACKSEHSMYVALSFLREMLIKVNIFPRYVQAVLRNVVGNATLNMHVDLNYVASVLNSEVCFEPQLFPGIVFKPHAGKATLLIFESGAIVLVGCKSEAVLLEIDSYIERIREIAVKAPVVKASGVKIHNYSKPN